MVNLAVNPQPVIDPFANFTNPDHHWLTYETLFNHKLFRKSNQQREMGLYRIPIDHVRIILRRDLPSSVLAELAAAFFPDLPQWIAMMDYADCPWNKERKIVKRPTISGQVVKGNRSANKLHLPPFAVMPYNFLDNDETSPAIGTDSLSRHQAYLLTFDKNTAQAAVGQTRVAKRIAETAATKARNEVDTMCQDLDGDLQVAAPNSALATAASQARAAALAARAAADRTEQCRLKAEALLVEANTAIAQAQAAIDDLPRTQTLAKQSIGTRDADRCRKEAATARKTANVKILQADAKTAVMNVHAKEAELAQKEAEAKRDEAIARCFTARAIVILPPDKAEAEIAAQAATTTAQRSAGYVAAYQGYLTAAREKVAEVADKGAAALQTPPPLIQTSLVRLKTTWPMWCSASRSCIVKIGIVKTFGDPWTKIDAADHKWPFPTAARGEVDGISGTQQFKMADLKGCFSVKVGVMWVGKSFQGGKAVGSKATLEENSILACLRSDYVAEVDKAIGHNSQGDPELLILTEILTVTENLGKTPGDGFQVRDLSCLKQDCVYLPALSIPYLDLHLNALQGRYACVEDDAWVQHWKQYYAQNLGRAKAQFLLRYGLQLATPNSQNFLLELKADLQPTGRIVIRDIGDAQLHTEVVWALYGKNQTPPPLSLKNCADLSLPVLHYECVTLVPFGDYYPGETGGDPMGRPDDYPAATQMHWHFYSSLGKGSAVAIQSNNSTDPESRTGNWQRVLRVNAEWGMAHNRAYVSYIQEQLGLAPLAIDWTTAPDPVRYDALTNDSTGFSQAQVYWKADVAWERAQAALVDAALKSAAGQKALRAYKARKWKKP